LGVGVSEKSHGGMVTGGRGGWAGGRGGGGGGGGEGSRGYGGGCGREVQQRRNARAGAGGGGGGGGVVRRGGAKGKDRRKIPPSPSLHPKFRADYLATAKKQAAIRSLKKKKKEVV